jgi:hypothetical protein
VVTTTTELPKKPLRRVLKKRPATVAVSEKSSNGIKPSPQHRLKIVHAGVKSLKHYPGNARRGNVPLIVESIKELGMYKPIVVNRRNRQVLAGNHTLRAAKALGWETIDVVFVDVDDEMASKINAVDNRTNDLATYDPVLLGKQLANMKTLKGTGYSADDVRVLVKTVDSTHVPKEKLQAILHPELREADSNFTMEDLPEEEREVGGGTHIVEAWKTKEKDTFGEAKTTFEGVQALSPKADFRKTSITPWQIPVIRDDMLMQTADLAVNYKSYVPSIYSDWPDTEQGWLTLYRPGNTRGLRYTDKAIWCFFTWDEFFEDFWLVPDIAVTKMINSGFKFSMAPDFSTWSDVPRVEALWALYKVRWLGRYMQEAGIKLVPHFSSVDGDTDFLVNYHNATLPAHCPVVALQTQKTLDYHKDLKAAKIFLKELEIFYKATTPEVLILYGVDADLEMVHRSGLPWRIILVDPFGNEMHKTAEARTAREVLVKRGLT